MAPKTITVKCPQCERVYIDWYTPAINPQSEQARTTACSKCGHRSQMSHLSDRNGIWQQNSST